MYPKYSVIVPTYNSQKIISDCLNALEDQTVERKAYEVIVVDDGSTDQTVEIVSAFPNVRIVPIPHGGPSVARNHGAREALGEVIAFTDSDCVPANNWLEKITAPFKNPAIIGVKGVYRTRQQGPVSRFVQLEYQNKYERMARQRYIDFIDTYSAAYRRKVFLANGGFDPSFTVPSVEDQELSFRLAQKGYRMVFASDAAVYHRHDKNLLEYWERKFGIGYWKAYMLRWLPQKMFTDSHTPPSLRLQIALLGLALLSAVVGVFLPWVLWLTAAFLIVFYLSGIQFWAYVARKDWALGWLFPVLLPVRAAALGAGLFVGFLSPPRRGRHDLSTLPIGAFLIKRVVDILAALIMLVVFLPVILLAGLILQLEAAGPLFFTQTRAGENGKPFQMYRLRTMVNGSGMSHAHRPDAPEPGKSDHLQDTHIGRWLRRWKIDSVPQFWNVLRGEMSLVGPKAEEPWVVEKYNDEQRKRLAFKPGVTGPMQVNGHGKLDPDQSLKLEIDYIRDYSILNDLQICSKSLDVIIKGKEAI